ncbi:hydroxyisourate hydrolase [Cellvibrio fibrivorans]|jgi:5-hydroxyisourate hydrolase|uniref:5-hydroxyisourate hydrolase n=1 Tax=Cellvibrio fibrivorans TaxID=126350 RepID=A0ABU1UZG3_9GAMM|nr:hydroxyisourate hydrolase [Cellvibrio fibrivorans]MDR7090589.1 5-hydroxyisourate hydrolase [Cellvibrio fibrivorans]
MKKAAITTHILNLDAGKPAADVRVTLHRLDTNLPIASATTDADGRIMHWENDFTLQAGSYLLYFAIGDWYLQQGKNSFYPEIQISFQVVNVHEHYHVPLLLNAYGYSTYRGS